MILNVIIDTLSDSQKTLLNKISSKEKASLIDLDGNNGFKKTNLDEKDRDILIKANASSMIFIYGLPSPEQLLNPVIRSLVEREYVFFVCDDLIKLDTLYKDTNKLISQRISNFILPVDSNRDDCWTVDEVFAIKRPKKTGEIMEGITEIKDNFHIIKKLSVSTFIQETLNTSLGIYWHLVRDVIFFFTYILFMLFMRGTGSIDGLPAVVFLVTGLVAWYFISDVLSGGVNCIRSSKGIISKMHFPITIIPIYYTLSILYRRGLTYIILFAVITVSILTGVENVKIDFLSFTYYTIAMIIVMIAYSMFMSAYVTVSRDFNELYKSFVRIQMYFVPIFWDISGIIRKLDSLNFAFAGQFKAIFEIIMTCNPIVYILNGYRASFGAYNHNTTLSLVIFWVVVLGLFILGFKTQSRMRKIYADII